MKAQVFESLWKSKAINDFSIRMDFKSEHKMFSIDLRTEDYLEATLFYKDDHDLSVQFDINDDGMMCLDLDQVEREQSISLVMPTSAIHEVRINVNHESTSFVYGEHDSDRVQLVVKMSSTKRAFESLVQCLLKWKKLNAAVFDLHFNREIRVGHYVRLSRDGKNPNNDYYKVLKIAFADDNQTAILTIENIYSHQIQQESDREVEYTNLTEIGVEMLRNIK